MNEGNINLNEKKKLEKAKADSYTHGGKYYKTSTNQILKRKYNTWKDDTSKTEIKQVDNSTCYLSPDKETLEIDKHVYIVTKENCYISTECKKEGDDESHTISISAKKFLTNLLQEFASEYVKEEEQSKSEYVQEEEQSKTESVKLTQKKLKSRKEKEKKNNGI